MSGECVRQDGERAGHRLKDGKRTLGQTARAGSHPPFPAPPGRVPLQSSNSSPNRGQRKNTHAIHSREPQGTKGPHLHPGSQPNLQDEYVFIPQKFLLKCAKTFFLYDPGKQGRFTLGDLLTTTQGLPASSKHPLSTLQVAPGRSLESQST